MNKRGQTALEYLVTYGWAILAIVIIAGVLWYFGVFTPGRFAPSEQTSGFATVIVLGHKVAASNAQLTLVLANQAAEPVNVTSVSAGQGGATATTLSLNSAGQGQIAALPTGLNPGNVGDTYSLNVTVTYLLTRTGLTKVSAGTISGRMS